MDYSKSMTGYVSLVGYSLTLAESGVPAATEFLDVILATGFMPLPQTETPGRLQAELMSRVLGMTRQRRIILSVVETATQHPDGTQILWRARKLAPDLDRVTVYRRLKLLKRHGLVDELDLMHLDGEKHYYERRPSRDHLHRPACAAEISEFESDLFDHLKKPDRARLPLPHPPQPR